MLARIFLFLLSSIFINANPLGDRTTSTTRTTNNAASGLNIFWTIVIIIAVCFCLYIAYLCLKSWCESIDDEKFDPRSRRKLVLRPKGLTNVAETCYLNAMLQAIASSDLFISKLEYLNSKIQNEAIALLLKIIYYINGNDTLNSNKDIQMLRKLTKMIEWKKTSRQDTYELLATLINYIQKCCSSVLEPSQMTMPLKLKIAHIVNTEDTTIKIQDHLGLSLPLQGKYGSSTGVTLESLIEGSFEYSPIDNSDVYYTEMLVYKEAPDVLLLHIQANEWDLEKEMMVKPTYFINYERDLNVKLPIFIDKDSRKTFQCRYKLTAVVVHSGATVSDGHYETYRSYCNNWFQMNDEIVSEVQFSSKICPYVLFYELQKRDICSDIYPDL